MAVENITLNLIPTGDTPSIHVAQFDVDRPFTVTLKEGEDDFTPTGYTIELQVRKVDNTIVTTATASVLGNVVTFNTTEQMTACSGTNLAELQLTKDSQTFATLYFYLVVQRDVLAGGVTSESDIYNLTEQIAEIVPEVIGDDYYNKEEVDEKISEIPTFDPTNYYDKADVNALLNDKADVSDLPDMTNYYNKSQTDALLNDKADVSDLPDMTNYYNKSETDALLNDKADVSDLPDMTDYYTKSEVDTKITDLYQIKTASGSIVHITDGGNAIPVKSLACEIVAVESGSGEKSPTNPYTVSGFANGVVTRCGKNLFNEIYPSIGTLQYMNIFVGKGKFTMSTDLPTRTDKYANLFFLANKVSSGADSALNGVYNNRPVTVTSTDGYVTLAYRYDEYNPENYHSQIEYGNQATTYEPYNGNEYTFTFGQTVFGGYFDNKGNLVVTNGFSIYDGSENWVYQAPNIFRLAIPTGAKPATVPKNCNMFTPSLSGADDTIFFGSANMVITSAYFGGDINAFKSFLSTNNLKIGYELVNTITLAITSQDIPTLSGENNIFSDCGDMEVKYFTSKSDGIAELIKAFM